MKLRLLGAVCASAITLVSMPANAALLSRLGGQAYYDTDLNITWMTNADVSNGRRLTWFDAESWAHSLTLGGFSDWRLPNMDKNGDGSVLNCATASTAECKDNEFGYMFHLNMVTNASPNPFTGIQLTDYWSSTEVASEAWLFAFVNNGFQNPDNKLNVAFAWAVHSGDVGASIVPVPASVWLFGSGLIGLIGVARRKAA